MSILNEIKGVFILPKKRYYFGKVRYGSPVFYPKNYNKFIISIKKNKSKYQRNKYFKLFGLFIYYGSPIIFKKNDIFWKDKYDSPRVEFIPSLTIYFFFLQFCIFYNSPDGNNDIYYEMILWYLYYSDKNIQKAKNTWGWKSNGTSTWNDNLLINNRKDKLKKILK